MWLRIGIEIRIDQFTNQKTYKEISIRNNSEFYAQGDYYSSNVLVGEKFKIVPSKFYGSFWKLTVDSVNERW